MDYYIREIPKEVHIDLCLHHYPHLSMRKDHAHSSGNLQSSLTIAGAISKDERLKAHEIISLFNSRKIHVLTEVGDDSPPPPNLSMDKNLQ